MATSRLVRPAASLARPAALLGCALTAAALAVPAPVRAAEPAACLSPDPSKWPAPSRPYFMLVIDTSGSMGTAIAGGTNSCGYQNNRIGHARCAVKNTVQAFSGEVNFGLATYSWKETACQNVTCGNCDQNTYCFTQCTPQFAAADNNSCGPFIAEPTLGVNVHSGASIPVPMLQDHYWASPPDPPNTQSILNLVDNNCGNSEIGARSNTPLGGVLFDMNQYFAGTFTDPLSNLVVPTPIGSLAQGERACRSLNVILVTDGDETCDFYNTGAYPNNEGLAVYEAGRLFNTGVNVGGQNFKIKTHVIGFVGATIAALNNIANAGGTGSAYSTANEAQLSQALANIVAGAIKPETCDNTDNNCNGCTDEGYTHYCDVQPVAGNCCTWATDAQRATCLTNYQSTITAANPKGDLTKLPCTTAAQQADPAHWLCYDPGDKCDNVDNNCNSQTDEGINKCGSPLHCPTTEVCNGQDDDCNGLIDEGAVCGACVPSPEICDGCDNDCNGIPDNGIAPIPCGLPSPPNCVGQLICSPKAPVPPGTCAPGGGFSTCNNNPLPETCDGLDNNCNGIVDDGIPSVPCVPANAPPGLDYGPSSQCKKGTTSCVNGMTVCNGWVGPSAEVCDGIDNNCDGTVDNNVPGVGLACGVNQLPCMPGVTACVNGALVCQGGVQPQPEVCDGKDNNCNGQVDEAPLADAPAPGMNGCWNDPGNCCHFPMINPDINWCPPPGGTCYDPGTLSPPCTNGTLVCNGLAGWTCSASKGPVPETCDGVDNNCNGVIDDGNLPGVGGVCGSNVGECKQGILTCTNGVLDCAGATGPQPEICDGKDNDCDGTVDNGIPSGAPCTPAYDTMAYPGPRNSLPCQPGIYQCNGMGGLVCVGGVGPSPEVCDGIDNDCDGQVDEPGAAPDGINGSPNPNPPPMANIGDPCGVDQGVCKGGNYACVNGMFACLGGQGPSPESCDCADNDCDGKVDNPNPNNMPPLCSAGKDCVKGMGGQCQCAQPCNPQAEFPCPGGQSCETVTDPETGMPKGNYCVSDACANCASATVKDANMNVVCAPAGTKLPNCVTPPVCVCKGQNGCQDPCLGVTCMAGTVCASVGPNAGKCVVDNCYNNPCQGCDKACHNGTCVNNPCTQGACPPDQECKPSADYMSPVCVPSCATVTCPSGKQCVDGACVDTCNPACQSGEVCDMSKTPPVCTGNKCPPNQCSDGSCCDPVTGACGNCPCDGIVCPDMQVCQNGQCVNNGSSSSSGSGGGASSSSASSTTSSASSGTGAGGGGGGIWGLATGGGGCSCEVGGSATSLRDVELLLCVAAAAIGARRRRGKKQGRGAEEVAS